MARPDHAVTGWVGLVVAALAWDVWLVRNRRRTLTDAARTPLGLAALGLFVGHVLRLLGRWDPFSFVDRRITRSPA